MRKYSWTVMLLSLALAGTVRAQILPGGQRASIASGAFRTPGIVNVPIDTSLVAAPFPQPNGGSFFGRLFRTVHFPGMPIQHGFSALPSPDSFPSTKYQNGVPVPVELKYPDMTPNLPPYFRKPK